ncbi:MAG TPA: NAD-dependent epimerase/dehydratase family protein [Ktedonobacteraceae bacterium]|nr:NAD-dependent epimerase/dehydratase family protein [Ktedonobacteraceae bacterium]
MRCLITGVAGFVGSHLAERLLADGHEVHGIDAFIDYYPRRIKELNLERLRDWEDFTFVEENILTANLFRLLEGMDWIFHQAAQAGVRASWGHEFTRYTECNILATQRLLEAASHTKSLRRFVYASSSSVYGETTALPVTEQVTPHPVSPYGVTKLAAEHLCLLYHRNFGVPTASLRYFTVYGPRQRPDMAFHRFCKSILDREAITIFGDGLQTRDFTYISDVVQANILAANADAASGEVMNIAGGSRVTLRSVLQLLQEISGSRIEIRRDNRQPGDVLDTFADTTRAHQLINYHPRVGLREGLTSQFEQVVSLYARVRR